MFFSLYFIKFNSSIPTYSKSLIIGTLINVILAIPGLIKNSKFLDYRDFLLIIPRNTTIPIIKDWEFFLIIGKFFLDLVIPIIKDLLYTFQSFIFFIIVRIPRYNLSLMFWVPNLYQNPEQSNFFLNYDVNFKVVRIVNF